MRFDVQYDLDESQTRATLSLIKINLTDVRAMCGGGGGGRVPVGGDSPPERPGDRAGQQDRAVPPRLESVAGSSYFQINSLLLLFLWNATLTTHTLLFGRYHDVLECFTPITF
jgi:hypothetical protein